MNDVLMKHINLIHAPWHSMLMCAAANTCLSSLVCKYEHACLEMHCCLMDTQALGDAMEELKKHWAVGMVSTMF